VNNEQRERRFAAALDVAWEAWWTDAQYRWRRYKPMIRRYGAVGTVKRQVIKSGVSPGFQKLADAGRLDLSMEALILQQDFAPLFDKPEQAAASNRLRDHGYEA
jgi:hypothetical protein